MGENRVGNERRTYTCRENETEEGERENEIERDPPKKTFGWPRKTTQEDEKLGDQRERHLVALARMKASICEGIVQPCEL